MTENINYSINIRLVLAVFVVTPLVYIYWNDLLSSLDGSLFKAVLIVMCAYAGTLIDLNDLSGQPHED